MAAAEGSLLGIALQSAAGTPNTTDSEFKYLLFNEGGVGPNSMTIPLDPEVGGGALLRDVVKVGVASAGAIRFIPRPETLGHFLYGVTGKVVSTKNANKNGVCGPVTLTASAQTGYTRELHQPETASALYIHGNVTGITGNVKIYGKVNGSADSETIVLNGVAKVSGLKLFSLITAIDFPARVHAGDQVFVGFDDDSYDHVFTLDALDNFAAPYYTMRSAPGALWGEQLQDMRVAMTSIEFKGADYVRSTAQFVGGLPTPVDTTNWEAESKVDSGPQFLAPYVHIELPVGIEAKVLSGSFAAVSNIPMDEQYIVGSFAPDGLDIVSRAYIMTLNMKLTSDNQDLYKKMQYDANESGRWTADAFKEGKVRAYFRSNVGQYALEIKANGSSGDAGNVAWTVSPIAMRAQRQLVMQVQGIFLADPEGEVDPLTITLTNKRETYAPAG